MSQNVPDRRQVLIHQARALLRDLTSPSFFDINETITFTINECDFEFTEEELDEQFDA